MTIQLLCTLTIVGVVASVPNNPYEGQLELAAVSDLRTLTDAANTSLSAAHERSVSDPVFAMVLSFILIQNRQ